MGEGLTGGRAERFTSWALGGWIGSQEATFLDNRRTSSNSRDPPRTTRTFWTTLDTLDPSRTSQNYTQQGFALVNSGAAADGWSVTGSYEENIFL